MTTFSDVSLPCVSVCVLAAKAAVKCVIYLLLEVICRPVV